MRRDPDGAIVLSRRNLLALLAKLDQPGSARTIMGGMACEGVEGLMIRSEDDAAHYADRAPGPMVQETELRMREM